MNGIKFSTAEAGALRIGAANLAPTNTSVADPSSYWTSIEPPTGGYTVYLDKATNGPSIYVANNDTELIVLTNSIAEQTFTTVAAALNWYTTQTDKFVTNGNYEGIVTNGLVLNLDAGFTPSYPRTGTTWKDLSGNGNDGTLTNGPAFNSANKGSIMFDGVNDFVTVADSPTLNFGTGNFTVLIWVSGISAFPGGGKCIIQKGGRFDGNVAGWSITWASSPQDLYFIISSDSTRIESRTQPNTGLNGWVGYKMLGMRRNNGNWSQIVDTTITSLGTFTGNVNGSSALNIGRHASYNSYLSNIVSNVTIYNRSLTSEEIQQNYNTTKSRYGL